MESVITYTQDGITYEVITKRSTGHWILYELQTASQIPGVMPWVLRYPSGDLVRFKTEYELWRYALIDKKLF